jgi:SAM-dependent methyltransferase
MEASLRSSAALVFAYKARMLAAGIMIAAAIAFPSLARDGLASKPEIEPLGPPGAPAEVFPKPLRPVAGIVTEIWSSEEARDRDGEAEQVMNFLKVGPGMTVADLGAGSGYYTVRLARRVGPTGQVIAEDVVPAYLQKLRERIERERLENVKLGLGEPHDPRLPPRSADLVLMVHMYHEIAQPYGFLFNLLPALRKGARVAVIDLDQPTQLHGTPRALLLCEFKNLGFRQTHWGWLRDKSEYLAVFEPPSQMPGHSNITPCTP